MVLCNEFNAEKFKLKLISGGGKYIELINPPFSITRYVHILTTQGIIKRDEVTGQKKMTGFNKEGETIKLNKKDWQEVLDLHNDRFKRSHKIGKY